MLGMAEIVFGGGHTLTVKESDADVFQRLAVADQAKEGINVATEGGMATIRGWAIFRDDRGEVYVRPHAVAYVRP